MAQESLHGDLICDRRSGRGRPGRFRPVLLLLAFLLLGFGAASAVDAPNGVRSAVDDAARPISYGTKTMGTWGTITIVTPDSSRAAGIASYAHEAWYRVDSLMSNWTATSEVARINRLASADTVRVHPEVGRVISAALAVGEDSGHAFDITIEPLVRLWGFLGGKPHVPQDGEIASVLERVGLHRVHFDGRRIFFSRRGMAIDLGGIAKGHGVDEAARILVEIGVRDAMVDLSGNMCVMGHPPGRDAWTIGIRDPRDRIPHVATLRVKNMCLATSGTYEQSVTEDGHSYGHIIDPRTGRPVDDLISTTVLARTAMDADAWATAFFVMGLDASKIVAKRRLDLAAVLIEPGDDGRKDTIWIEEEILHLLETSTGAGELVEVVSF